MNTTTYPGDLVISSWSDRSQKSFVSFRKETGISMIVAAVVVSKRVAPAEQGVTPNSKARSAIALAQLEKAALLNEELHALRLCRLETGCSGSFLRRFRLRLMHRCRSVARRQVAAPAKTTAWSVLTPPSPHPVPPVASIYYLHPGLITRPFSFHHPSGCFLSLEEHSRNIFLAFCRD